MAQVQVSKIQLRRGPAADLPGEPVAGNPTLPTAGLDTGEIAFTTDTGQVFIGIDPQQGGQTIGRFAFPFQNIEVLTENSKDRVQQFYDVFTREIRTSFFVSAPLAITDDPANILGWQPLSVPSEDQPAVSVTFPVSGNATGAATINYFIYDGPTPIRSGQMSVVSNGSSLLPALKDEYTNYARADLTNATGALDPNMVYGSIQFRAQLVADGTASQIVIQYLNLTSSPTIVVYFRVENPTVIP